MKRIAGMVVMSTLLASTLAYGESVPFDSSRWQISAQESGIIRHLGRDSLKLQGGFAWLPDVQFSDGSVTFDMAFSSERGFAGVIWRALDEQNYEHFYVRPHQSGQPDANQYTPVFNGVSGWQLYQGAGYSEAVSYEFEQWIPVKILVSGTRAEVYLGNMETPLFSIPELKQGDGSGALGLNAAQFAPAYFSNFSFDSADPVLANKAEPATAEVAPDMVASWQISNTFDESVLSDAPGIEGAFADSLTWVTLESEDHGFANIARAREMSEGGNTVFARLIIDSQQASVRLMKFGYSDRARVYLNGELIYAGDNGYQTRDYRYLGTIGLFDAVNLQLKRGTNEVWVAVSESFGGWGVMASLAETAD